MATSQKHFVISSAGTDIGLYSTKFTTGEGSSPLGTQILVEQFPSLAPKLTHKRLQHLPNSTSLDGAVITVDRVDYFVGRSRYAE